MIDTENARTKNVRAFLVVDGRKIHILMLHFYSRKCIMPINPSQSVHKGMLQFLIRTERSVIL